MKRCASILCSRNLVNFKRNNKTKMTAVHAIAWADCVSVSFIAGLPEPLDRDVEPTVPRFFSVSLYINKVQSFLATPDSGTKQPQRP